MLVTAEPREDRCGRDLVAQPRVLSAERCGAWIRRELVVADSGLFIGFGAAARGRERQAIKVFNEAFEYYSRLQQEGQIESFEPVLLEAHGGELGGFFLLRGDQDKLAHIRGSDEFERLTARALLTVDSIGIVSAALGSRVAAQMSVFTAQMEELT